MKSVTRGRVEHEQSQSQQELSVRALHVVASLHSPGEKLGTLVRLLRPQDLWCRIDETGTVGLILCYIPCPVDQLVP